MSTVPKERMSAPEEGISIVPKETIEVIAQTIGINNLSPEAALSLAPDVEYRMREIMQEAIKCMRHSRRTTLTVDDVDTALHLKNVEPIYGFASGDPIRFKKAVGHKDLYYIEDKDVELKDVIEAPLPKAPLDTSVLCHWLAIEGVQPAIPENASVEVISAPDSNKPAQRDDGLPVEIRLPIKHVLSKELQLYFDKITELTLRSSDTVLFKEALVSLATDAGLHPLIPYFTLFIADEVSHNLGNFSLLFALMRVVRSLLQNPHINLEPYLHGLMPSVVTCLVSKRLGNRIADNHWELRDFTANMVALICRRFRHDYDTLQTRLTKTLFRSFMDPKHALTQHYGAVQGLAALGPNVVRHLLLPNLESYLRLLEPEMRLEQKNEMKRHEAWRVYGALLHAAGQCIYDHLRIFPALPSPSRRAVWRVNAKVITANPIHEAKRKASMDHLEQQPQLKKVAVEGLIPTNSLISDMQGQAKTSVASDADPSSSAQTADESMNGSQGGKGKSNVRGLKMSAIRARVWKDDLESGKSLVALFELFGESIFSFIPAPEMSMFM